MFKNYIKIALRNMKRQKGYSFINIMGLAIGMASVLIIYIYVKHELSYDSYHKDSDRIYRIIFKGEGFGELVMTPPPMAACLKAELPEIESSTHIMNLNDQIYIRAGDKMFKETKGFFAEPDVFDIFSIPLISGDSKSLMDEPNTLMLSESTVKKYFGDADPLNGTLIRSDRRTSRSYKVIGVFRANLRLQH